MLRDEEPRERIMLVAATIALILLMAPVSNGVRIFVLSIFEFGLVGIALWLAARTSRLRSIPELRSFVETLQRFLPNYLSAFLVLDLTNLVYFRVGIQEIISPSRVSGYTYHHNSKLPFIAMVVALAIIPDFVLYWTLIPHKFLMLRVMLTASEIYAVFVCLGVFGSFVGRPHAAHDTKLVVNLGALLTADIPFAQIDSVAAIGRFRRRQLRSRYPNAALIASGDAPAVVVTIRNAAKLFSLFGKESEHSTWIIESDRPDQLVRALEDRITNATRRAPEEPNALDARKAVMLLSQG
jgi:hypothetical protein